MIDDDDDLKAILAAAPPGPPPKGAKDAAALAAVAAFDAAAAEENSQATQGMQTEPRQTGRQSGLMSLLRRFAMNTTLPSTKTLMLGSASLAVVLVAVFAAQQSPDLGLGELTAPEPSPQSVSDTVSAGQSPTEPAVATGGEIRAGDAGTSTALSAPSDQDHALSTDGFLADRRGTDDEVEQLAEREAPAVALQEEAASNAPAAPPPAPPAELTLPKPGAAGATGQRLKLGRLQGAAGQPSVQLRQDNNLSTRGSLGGTLGATGGATEQRLMTERDRTALAKPERAEAAQTQPADDRVQSPDTAEQGRDQFSDFEPNPIVVTSETPVSTFSVDVDTASYAFMRSSLQNRVLPQNDAVRIEELINYFPYDYAPPADWEAPFAANVSLIETPWNAETQLMRIGIKGYELTPAEKPRSNLVFLLDTSGSMNSPDKLPLLINSFSMLVDTLDADDTVSIVVYAGSAGTVLEPTKVSEKGKILRALDRLQAGGSTAGGEGIRQAYRLAEDNFDPDGINRVILATDGDFNVGIRNTEELKSFIERKRDTGVFLSVLGFGRGNYNDALMQALAQNGNGTANYIDTLSEAQKVLVDEAASTLFPIAKDVKIQVEFNPAVVGEYRLIGFETRKLRREDFNNDAIDAGEIGAGHTVTALYEITPTGSDALQVDQLRYQTEETQAAPPFADEYAFVKIRYKQPDADTSQLITQAVTSANQVEADEDARFAAAVAAFGQLLKGGRHTGEFTYDDVIDLARGARGEDPFGYRAEFVGLVRQAKNAAALERQR